MHLRKFGHPYLHELFKAVLLYDSHKVKEILARKIDGKLMREWTLRKAYQEISPSWEYERYSGNIDVLWVVGKPGEGQRVILHEVKTGKYNVIEVIKKYRKSHYGLANASGLYMNVHPTQTNAPLYIWGWHKYQQYPIDALPEWAELRVGIHGYNKDFEPAKLIKQGAVRQLPLEWLCPILERNIKEFYDVS